VSAWKPLPGHTLLVPSGPSGHHLFALILGPVSLPERGSAPQVAMVSFSTIRPPLPHDAACEVQAGEHPFIRHASYAVYRDVRIERADHVADMVHKTVWLPHEPCSPALLARLRAGVCASRLVSREVKLIFGSSGWWRTPTDANGSKGHPTERETKKPGSL
jgi:hypothetical protein